MSVGKSLSVYISPDTLNMLNDLKLCSKNTSVSTIINDAVKETAVRHFAGVNISSGAYICLAKGRFDLLQHVVLENGDVSVFVKADDLNDTDIFNDKQKLDEYILGCDNRGDNSDE